MKKYNAEFEKAKQEMRNLYRELGYSLRIINLKVEILERFINTITKVKKK